jgi:hypothetical protein
VDYGGTDHLFNMSLVPCKNPKILYDLKKLSLYITLPDLGRIVDHLAEKTKCKFVSRLRIQDSWVNVRQDYAGTHATIENGKYLFIYAMPNQVDVPEDQVNTSRKEDSFWKQSEIIRIGSKSHVCTHQFGENAPSICYCSDPQTHASYTEIGLLIYIDYSNEYVQGDRIVSKSESFRKVTANLLDMLKSEFVSWRGPHCFDNPDVNVRVFGDQFRKKAGAKGHR